jgi:hypothetical protein
VTKSRQNGVDDDIPTHLYIKYFSTASPSVKRWRISKISLNTVVPPLPILFLVLVHGSVSKNMNMLGLSSPRNSLCNKEEDAVNVVDTSYFDDIKRVDNNHVYFQGI